MEQPRRSRGRPQLPPDERRDSWIKARLNVHEMRAFNSLSSETGMNESDLIREGLVALMERRRQQAK